MSALLMNGIFFIKPKKLTIILAQLPNTYIVVAQLPYEVLCIHVNVHLLATLVGKSVIMARHVFTSVLAILV